MARYRDAIQWIADSDMSAWADESDDYADTVKLVGFLFGRANNVVEGDALYRRALDLGRHQRDIEAEEAEEARMMDDAD